MRRMNGRWGGAGGGRVAVSAYRAMGDPRTALRDCASGHELVALGYECDVEIAAEVDATDVVPVLRDDRFTPG